MASLPWRQPAIPFAGRIEEITGLKRGRRVVLIQSIGLVFLPELAGGHTAAGHDPVEGLAGQTSLLGRQAHIPVVPFQERRNVPPFCLDDGAFPEGFVILLEIGRCKGFGDLRGPGRGLAIQLQMFGGDPAAAGLKKGRFDGEFQLPDVARPFLPAQQLEGFGCEIHLFPLVFPAHCLQKMAREEWDVRRPFPQRRNRDAHGANPVEEIRAEFSLFGFRGQIAVGAAKDPEITGEFLRAAHRAEALGFQATKQLGLNIQSDFADFIEYQRSPVCGLQQPFLIDRAGEGPLGGAKEGRFDQGMRSGGAIHDHVGAGFSIAVEVDSLGDEFLAGPGFSLNQHREGGLSGPEDVFINRPHDGRGANHPRKEEFLVQHLAPDIMFTPQLTVRFNAADFFQEHPGGDRFGNEIPGTGLHGFHSPFDSSESGDDETQNRRNPFPQTEHQFNSVHIGQL